MRRKVSIISPDLCGNSLGRAYVLAKLLQEDFEVRVVAFGERDEIWPPIRNDTSIAYRRYHSQTVVSFWLNAGRTIRNLIDGDLIYAVKPLNQSFGLGLRARKLLGRPLLLDIDDWELGFLSDSVYWEFRYYLSKWFSSPGSPLYTRILNRFIKKADAVTVSNGFLQKAYGGTWIPHARDEREFQAKGPLHSGASIVPKTVVFLGTARGNKGLDDLLQAWTHVADQDARLRIIGTPKSSPHVQALLPFADNRTAFEGPVPFKDMPAILANAQVIVIPQKQTRGSIGQLPAKLIDAMAAGRPIVSTNVGDIPEWLTEGAGLIVPAGNPLALGQAIQHLLDNPKLASECGERARSRFLRFGSFTAVRPRLVNLVNDLINGHRVPAAEPVFAGRA